jgi:hypothetical protein
MANLKENKMIVHKNVDRLKKKGPRWTMQGQEI